MKRIATLESILSSLAFLCLVGMAAVPAHAATEAGARVAVPRAPRDQPPTGEQRDETDEREDARRRARERELLPAVASARCRPRGRLGRLG